MGSTRLLPLTGGGAILLTLASFVAAGSQPAADAPVNDVVAFYTRHGGGQIAAGALLSLGALLFLTFAAALAALFRRADGRTDGFATLCLAGGILVAGGLAIVAGLMLAIGEVADDVDPATLRALHVLTQELFFPLTLGTAAFMLGAGAAVLSSRMFATWLGWTAVALGIVAAIPSHVLGGVLDHVGFFAFVGLLLWTLTVCVVLATRSRRSSHT